MIQLAVNGFFLVLLVACYFLKEKGVRAMLLFFCGLLVVSAAALWFLVLPDTNLVFCMVAVGAVLGILGAFQTRFDTYLKKVLVIWIIFISAFVWHFKIFYVPSIFNMKGVYLNLSLLNDFRANTYWGFGQSATNKYGQNKLHKAIRRKDVAEVRELLEKGYDVNLPTKRGETPMYLAFNSRNWEIIMLLEKRGALFYDDKNHYDSVLHGVAGMCSIGIYREFSIKAMNYLLEKGVPVDTVNHYGNTPLFYVFGGGISYRNDDGKVLVRKDFPCVRLLVENGADVNFKGIKNNTPLHSAAKMKFFPAVQYLIERGADVNAENDNGETPLDWAYDAPYYGAFENGNPTDDMILYSNKTISLLESLMRESR